MIPSYLYLLFLFLFYFILWNVFVIYLNSNTSITSIQKKKKIQLHTRLLFLKKNYSFLFHSIQLSHQLDRLNYLKKKNKNKKQKQKIKNYHFEYKGKKFLKKYNQKKKKNPTKIP